MDTHHKPALRSPFSGVCPHCYGHRQLYRLVPAPVGWFDCKRCSGTGRFVPLALSPCAPALRIQAGNPANPQPLLRLTA